MEIEIKLGRGNRVRHSKRIYEMENGSFCLEFTTFRIYFGAERSLENYSINFFFMRVKKLMKFLFFEV